MGRFGVRGERQRKMGCAAVEGACSGLRGLTDSNAVTRL